MSDATGDLDMMCFTEHITKIFDMSTNDLAKLREEENEDYLAIAQRVVNKKFYFKIIIKASERTLGKFSYFI